MKLEQVSANLDKMLLDPKAKGFLTHLIKAYMPTNNVTQVTAKPRGVEFKCVLTKEPLISQGELLEGVHSDAFKTEFFEFAKTMLNESSDKTTPMSNLIGDRKLALTGKDTTSFMAYSTYVEFSQWVYDKLLAGEKHVTWMLKSMNKGQSSPKTTQPFKSFQPSKRPTMEGVMEKGVAATFSLGDLFAKANIKIIDDEPA